MFRTTCPTCFGPLTPTCSICRGAPDPGVSIEQIAAGVHRVDVATSRGTAAPSIDLLGLIQQP
jgi:hypothetical protein